VEKVFREASFQKTTFALAAFRAGVHTPACSSSGGRPQHHLSFRRAARFLRCRSHWLALSGGYRPSPATAPGLRRQQCRLWMAQAFGC